MFYKMTQSLRNAYAYVWYLASGLFGGRSGSDSSDDE